MAFDQPTRNRLQRFVNDARRVLEEEFTRQLQNDFGLDPNSGAVTDLANLRHINDAQRESARILRDTLSHYCASGDMDARQGLDRIVREQAFTVLNRLAALRMAEARGLLVESVANGFQAKGFQLYARLTGAGLGETGEAYRTYLFSVFDELAQDLPGLYDRYSPQGRLFPRESALLQLLALLNSSEIEPLWGEDETIGWIYQYFNSVEERKKMREARAPRNSRELAVRNQFFTPRYVVEFLVDNTLGRLWLNATGGVTDLRVRCQYLLLAQTDQAQAAIKLRDPRTLKLLDPACGSMHFGLYAFDLFAEIYREAWAWEQQHGPGSLDVSTQPQAELKPLSQTYADDAAFLRDVPRLIIEHNIYGVDIDPRAAQIASLALWLRAQRAWHEAGVKAKDRPLIGRGHVVAAIAPPVERELRLQVQANLSPLDGELFEKTLHLLKGLPELGVLLRVERELPNLIRKVYVGGKGNDLFSKQEQETWGKAEFRLRNALIEYAHAAESSYQGRLFAQDALEGLRLIDITREQFDVVVMNPPFGALSLGVKDSLVKDYPLSKNDLLAIFVERGLELLRPDGRIGAITSRACFFLSSFENWREKIVMTMSQPECFADFGHGVMDDAMVEAAAYVFRKPSSVDPQKNNDFTCIRLLKDDDKNAGLLSALRTSGKDKVFLADIDAFKHAPGKAFTYWISKDILKKLSAFKPIEGDLATIKVGLQTGDDWRFLRQWWEVKNENIANVGMDLKVLRSQIRQQTQNGTCKWVMYSKTDYSAPWYSPLLQVVNWTKDGEHFLHFTDANGKLRSRPQNTEYYFQPGFSYMLRSFRLVPYIVPAGAVPTAGRAQVFPLGERIFEAFAICASNLGSAVARFNGENFARPKFQAGMVQGIPATIFDADLIDKLKSKVRNEVERRRRIFQMHEPFVEFVRPAYLEQVGDSLSWQKESLLGQSLERQLAAAYGLSADELQQLEKDIIESIESQRKSSTLENPLNVDESDEDSDDSGDAAEVIDESARSAADGFISYLVGCAFCRWDIRQAVGSGKVFENINPFAPISRFPPGALRDEKTDLTGANLIEYMNKNGECDYPLDVFLSGVAVEDSSNRSDIVSHIEEAFRFVFKLSAEEKEREICAELEFVSIRDYFKKPNGFFADHLQRYSKSRRKAPIYWPLSTSSGSYSLWLYYPSLSGQTLYSAINDFVEPKLKQVESDVAIHRNRGAARSRDDERQFEALQVFELELIELRDTLLKLAPNYKPNHDDGVQISAAPLWPLFRHKPWQKVLKDTWIKLEKGDYDWAHMAMNYWPDRVREKCKTDKSLAIAHGLENLYVELEAKPKKARSIKKGGMK